MEKGKTYYVVCAPPGVKYVFIDALVFKGRASEYLCFTDMIGRKPNLHEKYIIDIHETLEAAREAADKRLDKIK